MTDFVKNHALTNVWCEPSQDRQHNIRLSRLTTNGGKKNRVRVGWVDVKLPDEADGAFWHVYQIGQLHPQLINAIKVKEVWRSLVGICEENNLQIDLFVERGIQIPKSVTYMRWTHDNNLLLCTKIIPGFAGYSPTHLLDSDNVYVRFYSNAYYDTSEWLQDTVPPTSAIRIVGGVVTQQADFVALRQQWNSVINSWSSLNTGQGMWFLDGYAITRPTAYNAAQMFGKYLEFIWDASVRNQYRELITNIESFTSTLDAAAEKLLIMPFIDYDNIAFKDDIDVYLGFVNPDGTYKGIYISSINDATVRMVTHNAYSIAEAQLTAFVAQNAFMGALSNCRLIVNIRKGGMKPGLIYQHNRIKELYRMPRSTRIGAMIGVNATVPEWNAAALEASQYSLIMGKKAEDIIVTDVEDAYGYNALVKYFADAYDFPLVEGSQRYAIIPPGLCTLGDDLNYASRSIYSYNPQGKFIGQTNNSGTYNQVPVDAFEGGGQPFLFEMLGSLSSATSDGCKFPYYHSGTNTFTETVVQAEALKRFGFRCYACPIVAGVPNEDWQDITDNPNYYTYSEVGTPTLTWNTVNLISSQLFPCVKIANNVLFYKVPLDQVVYPGFIRFSVNSTVRWMGSNIQRVQSIPTGSIDVFMDGENLMEGFDYHVIWPQIVVVKKPQRTPSEGLEVFVRCAGFCDPVTMLHHGPRDSGFVKGGLVSVDGQFDVRNDRVSRIIVGGSVKHPTQVRFIEDGTGLLVQDGLPFVVKDVFVPIERFTSKQTLPFRQISMDLDTVVQNYLNVHITEDTPTYPTIINDKWAVYSPFMAAIIKSVQDGLPTQAQLEGVWNNLDVAGWVSQFIYLLDYDPCVIGVDENYIVIDPHHYDAGPKEGGLISPTLNPIEFTITAGHGYVVTNGIHNDITWSAQTGICPYQGMNYIGINQLGQMVITNYQPPLTNYIALGYVFTNVTNSAIVSYDRVRNQAIPMSQEQYAYLEYINTHYLNGKLDLTHFLTTGS